MRHNNPLPDHYLRKHWQKRVKTWFDQPGRKKRRRLARKAKAAKVFPRPSVGPIRPIVQCPTFKHNLKSRLGRGFTLEELKAAKVNKLMARTIGISVDHRRKNRSVEGMEQNVARLTKYLANLVLFPKKMSFPKAGEASATEMAVATQHQGHIYPVSKKRTVAQLVNRDLLDGPSCAYKSLIKARGDLRNHSYHKKKAEATA